MSLSLIHIYGEYTVKETEVPQGYVDEEYEATVTVSAEKSTYSLEAVNKYNPVSYTHLHTYCTIQASLKQQKMGVVVNNVFRFLPFLLWNVVKRSQKAFRE